VVFKAAGDITLDAGASITANGASGGTVTLDAAGTALVYGRIEAAGSEGRGGNVQVLGNQVGLIANASIDASGATGGGTVLIGGDMHGGNAACITPARLCGSGRRYQRRRNHRRRRR